MASSFSTDGHFKLKNQHLDEIDKHNLYHIGLEGTKDYFQGKFGDLRFVCIGGTKERMEKFAKDLAGSTLHTAKEDIKDTERFITFKVGPVLIASHGMGTPSVSILLNEIFKLLHLAGCRDVTLIRIGTCGSVGVQEGTVVITEEALNNELQPIYNCYSAGILKQRPTIADHDLARELMSCARELMSCASDRDKFDTVLGKTLCADDFYEGQSRRDGAMSDISEEEKNEFMRRLQTCGVKNIEMESTCVLALSHEVGVKAAVVCVSIVDRLKGDDPNGKMLEQYESRPQKIVAKFLKSRI